VLTCLLTRLLAYLPTHPLTPPTCLLTSRDFQSALGEEVLSGVGFDFKINHMESDSALFGPQLFMKPAGLYSAIVALEPGTLQMGLEVEVTVYNKSAATVDSPSGEVMFQGPIGWNLTFSELLGTAGVVLPFLETFGANTGFGSLTAAPLPCAFRHFPKSASLTAAVGIDAVDSPNGEEFLDAALPVVALVVSLITPGAVPMQDDSVAEFAETAGKSLYAAGCYNSRYIHT
jgi:hypothetical protein